MANNNHDLQLAFQDWRQECEIVERQMDQLLQARFLTSEAEHQVRRSQFAALIERRNAAASKLLKIGSLRHW